MFIFTKLVFAVVVDNSLKTTLTLDGHAEIDNGEQSFLHISKEIACEKVVIIWIYTIVT